MTGKKTIEEAKEVAEKLKRQYKYGTPKCPSWFNNAVPFMYQDGSFGVDVSIPSWSVVDNDCQNRFLELFEGLLVGMRVVVPAVPIDFDAREKKAVEAKNNAGSYNFDASGKLVPKEITKREVK